MTTTRLQILFVLIAWCLLAMPTQADEHIECGECHDDVVVDSPAHPDVTCLDCHSNVTEEHEDEDLEPLTDEESCGGCHRKPHRSVGRSAHKGEASCNDCHGDPHNIHWVADL